jgi:hypothetical protein
MSCTRLILQSQKLGSRAGRAGIITVWIWFWDSSDRSDDDELDGDNVYWIQHRIAVDLGRKSHHARWQLQQPPAVSRLDRRRFEQEIIDKQQQ